MSDETVDVRVHAKLHDDTRCCSAADDGFATVLWGIVDCPDCLTRLDEIVAEREARADGELADMAALGIDVTGWQRDALRAFTVVPEVAFNPDLRAHHARRAGRLAAQRQAVYLELALGRHVHVVTGNPRGIECPGGHCTPEQLRRASSGWGARPGGVDVVTAESYDEAQALIDHDLDDTALWRAANPPPPRRPQPRLPDPVVYPQPRLPDPAIVYPPGPLLRLWRHLTRRSTR